jgi:hypothetical protein
MVELGCSLGFVVEPLQMPRIEHRREGQDFEGDPPLERELFGFVYDAHSAAADLAKDVKISQDTARFSVFALARGRLATRLRGCRKYYAVDLGTPQFSHQRHSRQEWPQTVGECCVLLQERFHIGIGICS